ncbi:hypothetical protein SmphiM6_121 [Sinorhizobium phage phiM6]|nr:hypothetical protein SmphiM6_121 [Sinorhizobium phage phiM6]
MRYAIHMPNGKLRLIEYSLFRTLKAMGGYTYEHEGMKYVCIKGASLNSDGSIDFE